MQPDDIQPNSWTGAGAATALDKTEAETVRRHRILIAAAVAALFSGARVTGIKPAVWTLRRPAGVRRDPDFRRQIIPVEPSPETAEE